MEPDNKNHPSAEVDTTFGEKIVFLGHYEEGKNTLINRLISSKIENQMELKRYAEYNADELGNIKPNINIYIS